MSENMKPIRGWLYLDVSDVKKHLLLIEDIYGMCANCKHLGISYIKEKKCPNCNTEFKYLTSSLKKDAEIAQIAGRIKRENLSLVLIDKNDYDRAGAKDSIHDLFKQK